MVIVAQASYLGVPVRGDIIHPMQMRTDRPIQRLENPAMLMSSIGISGKIRDILAGARQRILLGGSLANGAHNFSLGASDNLDDHRGPIKGSLDTLVIWMSNTAIMR